MLNHPQNNIATSNPAPIKGVRRPLRKIALSNPIIAK
jgi:hypothetical protein